MAYHNALYLFIFLPIALLTYQLTPKTKRWITLLMFGYLFFWMISGKLLLYLIITTIFTHYVGIWMTYQKTLCDEELKSSERETHHEIKDRYKKKEKRILLFGITIVLLILAYLKYYNFFVMNTNIILEKLGNPFQLRSQKLLLPIGISFYSLQVIGYMLDVYWGKIKAEQHIGKIALFLGFFPQIMEGPISMYSQTAEALWKGNSLRRDNLTKGSIRISWGLFKKMIIADRLYVVVQTIFDKFDSYHGVMILVGAIAYTIQLYMEFSGCMDIVIGSGKLFGIDLPENFRQPFFSKNASEFWTRWHITLGIWFKTYIFYPISTSRLVKKWNKYGKKNYGKYITKLGISALCLLPVWICNGLWHGPRWNYIFYGMYYFVILMIEIAMQPLKRIFYSKIHMNQKTLLIRLVQIFRTWIIILIGEMFFRAAGLRAGFSMFCSIFQDFELYKLWNGTIYTLGLDKADLLVIGIGCLIVWIVDLIMERKLLNWSVFNKIWESSQWVVLYALIIIVIVFGAYGVGYQQVDLIYAGF